jgi:hypothetical protein
MAAVARVGHSALTGRWEQRLDAARVTGSDPRGGCVAAKFVLLGLDRQVPLQLGRPNGQVIATSEAYETKASAIKASSRSSATPPAPRSTTRATSGLLFCSMPASALPCPAGRSVSGVAEERSAGGVRTRWDRSPPVHSGYTRSRQIADRGVQWAPAVTTGAKEPQVSPPVHLPPGPIS